mgnify:CR=1 FL=1
MALIIFMALNFSFFGLKITNPLISSMISLSGPFITMFLGVLFFKEPITKLEDFKNKLLKERINNKIFNNKLFAKNFFILIKDLLKNKD